MLHSAVLRCCPCRCCDNPVIMGGRQRGEQGVVTSGAGEAKRKRWEQHKHTCLLNHFLDAARSKCLSRSTSVAVSMPRAWPLFPLSSPPNKVINSVATPTPQRH